MKPAAFRYHRPGSIDEALGMLAALAPDASVLAGGLSLMPLLKSRAIRPADVVDIGWLTHELGNVVADGVGVRVGALVRQDEVAATHHPLLADCLGSIGNWQTRGIGTIGGLVAFADPLSQIAAVCGATGATVVARSRGKTRILSATALFTGAERLNPAELVTELTVPRREGGCAFFQIGRRAVDTTVASVAVWLRTASGRCVEAVICPVTSGHPGQPVQAAARLIGTRLTAADLRSAAEGAAAEISPRSDVLADAAYRRAVVAVLTRRALRAASGRAADRVLPTSGMERGCPR